MKKIFMRFFVILFFTLFVFVSIDDSIAGTYAIGQTNGSTTSVDIYVVATGGGTPTINIFWLAIGA